MARGHSRAQTVLLGLAVLASAWAILTPLLIFLPIYDARPAIGETINAIDAGRVGETLALLGPVAGLGLVGLAGVGLLLRGAGTGRAFLGVSAAALLVLSVFTALSLGLFLLPASLFFLFPALWLKERPGRSRPPEGSVGRGGG